MSYVAVQRQAEMGVRMALGATSGDVVSMLVGSAAKLAAIGVVCGLALALAAGRLVESMLFGIRPRDPLAIVGAVVLLSVAALVAAAIPAVRAGRADPALALRGVFEAKSR
jgi:ABC-type antimicrobial peptide transport system permease subunit